MKKSLIFLLSILVVGLLIGSLVIANGNGNNNQTGQDDDENETEFCEFSSYDPCESNNDCRIDAGPECKTVSCENRTKFKSGAGVCSENDCFNYAKYRMECKCIENQCKWEKEKKNKTQIKPGRDIEECPEGCECMGSVVRCSTETGRIMIITAGKSGNVIIITMNKTNVSTTITIEKEGNKFYANVSGGRKEIKVLPDVASERAQERFRIRNYTVELKEVGNKLVYEFEGEKEVRVLLFFKARMKVMAQTDAESGDTIQVKKPWWAFLAA